MNILRTPASRVATPTITPRIVVLFVEVRGDEAMLANSRQLDALAGAIVKSIDNYFSPQVVTASL